MLYRRYPYMLLSPAMLVPFVLILILLGFHISYDTYMTDNHWIVWMLGPLHSHSYLFANFYI